MYRTTHKTNEYGNCELCNNENVLLKTIFHYEFMEGNQEHTDVVLHCHDCVPPVPLETKVTIIEDDIVTPYILVSTEAIDYILKNKI